MQVRIRSARVEMRPHEIRTAGEPLPDVARLVVVRDDRLGDVVATLPSIDALRRVYPAARLALMVRPAIAPLIRMVRGVDDVLEARRDAAAMRRTLVDYAPDLLICVSRGPLIPWAGLRAAVRHRVGTGRRFYTPLFTRVVDERRRRGGRHEVEYSLSFAHRVGATAGPARFGIDLQAQAKEDARGWLDRQGIRNRFAVLHGGSGGSCPVWPASRYLELAGLLREQGIDVVLSIGPQDDQFGAALARGSEPSYPRFTGGLVALTALVALADVTVSNSTGPLHLAAAQGRPTLALHAPWDTCGVVRWGPYAANGLALIAESAEARGWSRGRRRRHGSELIAQIPAQAVVHAVTELLEI